MRLSAFAIIVLSGLAMLSLVFPFSTPVSAYDIPIYPMQMDANNTSTNLTGPVIITLLIGFSLIACGFIEPLFHFFGGMVWIYAGLGQLNQYGDFFIIIGLGIGMVLMIRAGMKIMEGEK